MQFLYDEDTFPLPVMRVKSQQQQASMGRHPTPGKAETE